MSKAEWGAKRICPNCGKLYYDMKKNPPVCPACKTPFDSESLMKARRGRIVEKKPVAKDTVDDVIGDLPDTGGSDDSVIEDVDELSDDDVEDVVDVEGDDENN